MIIIKTITILIKLLNKIFKIIIFPKKPKRGGIPPKDMKIIIMINLSKNIIEFICVNIFKP